MRAVVLQHLGEVPRFSNFHDPEPREGETLVRASAALVRPSDVAIARGQHPCMPLELPYICGRDGVGYLAGGQRVYFHAGRSPFGAMAEFVPAEWVVPVPDEVDSVDAAALVGPALKMWLPLAVRADLAPGETVLILGASGMLGRLAIQAARLQGAGRVIVAGHRIDLLTMPGADAQIDLGQAPSLLQHAFATHAADGIDAVLDFVWGETLELLLSALVQAGSMPTPPRYHGTRVVCVADRRTGSLMMAPTAMRDSCAVLMGCGPASHPPPEDLRYLVEDILGCMRTNHLSVEPAEAMPAAEVAAVWRLAGESERRVVLTLD